MKPTKLNKEQVKAEAFEYYVKKGMSIDTIFRILPEGCVSRKTLFNWKERGEWDQAKVKFFNRAKGFDETLWGLAEIYAEAARENPDPQLAYSISSLVTALMNNKKLKSAISDELKESEGEQKKSSNISKETLAKIHELLGLKS
ncbi:MAG: hypothetical protein LC102_09110 [Ignavibacteriales bacterium]|jgi:hypothetical protein|nr:MAG: hypothetical protein F9K26_05405 [Ignavibacteriaceae bacterium]MBW7872853.1 hypothetical protein [Ignavibacteria bacterium]MCZ2143573.1 hypothetical protein [Ignavibacteriales bacterium]OQY73329.1 MAG: hypothetical protein B6D45_08285 [Ignavibacteriales bacterium UTCHB3]MBV6444448.1 hypothetical protein [Ignavibacteriaceae bacterium]